MDCQRRAAPADIRRTDRLPVGNDGHRRADAFALGNQFRDAGLAHRIGSPLLEPASAHFVRSVTGRRRTFHDVLARSRLDAHRRDMCSGAFCGGTLPRLFFRHGTYNMPTKIILSIAVELALPAPVL